MSRKEIMVDMIKKLYGNEEDFEIVSSCDEWVTYVSRDPVFKTLDRKTIYDSFFFPSVFSEKEDASIPVSRI